MRFFSIVLMVWLAAPRLAAAQDFYVAPNGRDTWSGRLASPNARATDGPFATLERATEAVKKLQFGGPARKAPVRVSLRGGLYFLARPLELGTESSGTAAAVVYEAYRNEKPILSGGRLLTGWTVTSQRRWEVRIPEAQSGEWNFTQLFVNGQRRYRPRLPKKGYFTIADALPPSPKAAGRGIDRFKFNAGEIRPDWTNLGDVEVLGFQTWTMARLRIQSVEDSSNSVTFTGNTRGLEAYASLPRGNRFLVENVAEALSEPGEFYLNRKSGILSYIPMPGEKVDSAAVIAPRLEKLLVLKDARSVRFRGITFSHTNWVTPPEGNAFPQAEVNLGAAITAERAQDIEFDHCVIEHTGAYGLELGRGCKRVVIQDCRISDLSGGGIKIGEMGIDPDDEQVASDNSVRRCLIAHGGRMHPAAVGVWIGQSHNNTIEGNEIADFYYTGISVGWTWGYGPSLAHHNFLERNHIHDIGQGVLSDMGGIYTLGISPGTVLRGNRIHDVNSFGYGGWGIYPDEGTSSALIEDNVVFRTKSAGFHQHYGRENIVRNNVFAFGREAQIMRTRAENHLSFTFEGNVVYWAEGVLLGSNWSGNNYKLDRNVYWQAAGKPFDFAGIPLDQWRQKGQDVSSIVGDPGFRDPLNGDFRLKPASQAVKLGFRISPAAAPEKAESRALPAFPTLLP